MLPIPPETLARLRVRQALIAQYQLLIEDLQAGMVRELAAPLDSGEWEIDLECGVVTRKEATDGPALEQQAD